jgi:hypothetical protein
MYVGLSFCNLERHSGSGIFSNIWGTCLILPSGIGKLPLLVTHLSSWQKSKTPFTTGHLNFNFFLPVLQRFWNVRNSAGSWPNEDKLFFSAMPLVLYGYMQNEADSKNFIKVIICIYSNIMWLCYIIVYSYIWVYFNF